MLLGKKILAVVPARSGSKGIPDKNIRKLCGTSLIGYTGNCLSELSWLDASIISTDSESYAEEGKRYGIDAPFIRPAHLASDTATAIDTMIHALKESEVHYGCTFDLFLLVEPTSPLRRPEDILGVTQLLAESGADSVITVSPVSSKQHPHKILKMEDNHLVHYEAAGEWVTARQQLSELYIRNGVCYAVTRQCLLEQNRLFTDNTLPYVIERELVNIDESVDFEWAEFLLGRSS